MLASHRQVLQRYNCWVRYLGAALVILLFLLRFTGNFAKAWLGETGLLVVFCGACVVVGVWWALKRWADMLDQHARDADLWGLVRRLEHPKSGGPVEPYCLYLRPFAATGQVSVAASPSRELHNKLTGERPDLEDALRRSLAPMALVSVGGSLTQPGAARLYVDDDRWQTDFKLLAKHAHTILMLPCDSEGVGKELETVLKVPKLLQKTILIMPGTQPWRLRKRRFDVPAEWQSFRNRWLSDCPGLPEHREQGLLFRLDRHGNATDATLAFDIRDEDQLAQALAELLARK